MPASVSIRAMSILSLAAWVGILGLGTADRAAAEECKRLDMEVVCAVSQPMVLVGDPFTATATVKNTGDWPLANVVLAIRAQNVQTVSQEPLSITVEKMEPGETRDIRATFVSDGVGERRVEGHAKVANGWAAAGCTCGVTIKGLPALQVEMIDVDANRGKEGVWTVGQDFIYQLTVENDRGTAITPDLKVVWTLPAELQFVSGVGSEGITVTGQGQSAESSAFVLAPDQVQTFEMVVKVLSVPERFPLVQTRASIVSVAGGTELAVETESTTLRNKAQ